MPRMMAFREEDVRDPRELEPQGPSRPSSTAVERTIDFTPEARAELADVFRLAMEGALPVHRKSMDHEPDKLNAEHIQMVMMKASGIPQGEIASILGYSETRVSIVLTSPLGKALLAQVLMHSSRSVLDIPTRIQRMAPAMLDVVEEIALDPTVKPEVRSHNAFKWLAMAGHSEEKKAKITHELSMPKGDAQLLADAIRESRGDPANDVTNLGRVSILGQPVAPGGGPVSPAPQQGVVKPPLDGSQGHSADEWITNRG